MREIIIDTNCESNDVIALMIALKSRDISVGTIAAVGGNVSLDFAVKNALMTMEVTGDQRPPLFVGAVRPLFREFMTAVNIHSKDSMGDAGLIRPTLLSENEHAMDIIVRIVESCPGEVEFIAVGPATDTAPIIMKDSNTMERIKQVYTMGISGFDPGNCTSISGFSAYVDAGAFHITITTRIPITITGFDLCLGKSALTKAELDILMSSRKREAIFAVTCNRMVVDYNITTNGQYFLDLPGAVAMGVILWDDIVPGRKSCYIYVCLREEVAHGQAILNDGSKLTVPEGFEEHNPSAGVYAKIDTDLFKRRLLSLLV